MKQGEELYINELQPIQDNSVDPGWVHYQLLFMYYNFVGKEGVEPFRIAYGRANGLYITSTLYIGVFRYDQLTLIIEPKIPGLDIGKVLYLSSQAGIASMNASGKVLNSQLTGKLELNAIDYFVLPFLDKLEEIVKNGLLRIPIAEKLVSQKLKGRLNIRNQLVKNPSYDRYHIIQNKYSSDIIINQILKLAIYIAMQNTSIDAAVALLKEYDSRFSDVSMKMMEREKFSQLLDEYTTIKRDDYKVALILAEHIIFGYDPTYGMNFDLFPEYYLNLNVVFEGFIVNSLSRRFKEGYSPKRKYTLGFFENDPCIEERFIELDAQIEKPDNVVVIDAKNKFSNVFLSRKATFIPSNPDIYQQYYYAHRVNAKDVLMVYPSTVKWNQPISTFTVKHGESNPVNFHIWPLLITGTPHENESAINKLAEFINDKN